MWTYDTYLMHSFYVMHTDKLTNVHDYNTIDPTHSFLCWGLLGPLWSSLFEVLFNLCIWGFTSLATLRSGHITTGSWKGRGNQYIQLVKVLYCKLPTNGMQLPAFPLEVEPWTKPGLRGGRRECYHSATVAPWSLVQSSIHCRFISVIQKSVNFIELSISEDFL